MKLPEGSIRICLGAIVPLLASCLTRVYAEEGKIGLYSVLASPDILLSSKSKGQFDYFANNSPEIGFSISYKKYNFEVAPPIMGESKNHSSHPKTTYFSIMTSHYARRWGADFYYQHFKGFYSDVNALNAIDRPNFKTNSMIANGYFPISPKSKVMAMDEGIDNNGVDINFLGILGFERKSFITDSSLLFTNPQWNGSALDSLRKIELKNIFLGVGFCFNAFYKGGFLDYSLFLGGGPEMRDANVDMPPFDKTLKLHLQISGGYQLKRGTIGFKTVGDMSSTKFTGEGILTTTTATQIYLSIFIL
jgi:hypothetical protein